MKNLILFWQKVHFNVYRFHLFVSVKIIGLPFDLLLNNKLIVSLYKKRGVENPAELVRKVTTRPDIGPLNWNTDGTMILLVVLMALSILNFVTAIAGYLIWSGWKFSIYFILIGIPSISINYYALWKDDKYLNYYKVFAKESKQEKSKWAWISFTVVVVIILVLVSSFKIMTNSLRKNKTREEKIEIILTQEEYRLYKGDDRVYDEKIEDRLEQIEDSLRQEKNIVLP